MTWGAAVVLALGFAGALYLFQPWRLFTTVRVDEPVPPAAAAPPVAGAESSAPATESAAPEVIATGRFVSHEHATSGTARILRLADGSRVLRVEDLDTSDGPDLRVWLSDQPVKEGTAGWRVFDDGAWVELGALKGNQGNANYAIPADADLGELTSVTIWCRRFAVSFGAAALKA
ncbi:DM13 domain-containing protein [Sphaerisporangium aureirubrum]|uniref:DM13 domain-containing protein n=1 Tax=Sphaerisporangium aureirubrum TaxID=1544736 RepID=A0ABW1NKT0_9ACTN